MFISRHIDFDVKNSWFEALRPIWDHRRENAILQMIVMLLLTIQYILMKELHCSFGL